MGDGTRNQIDDDQKSTRRAGDRTQNNPDPKKPKWYLPTSPSDSTRRRRHGTGCNKKRTKPQLISPRILMAKKHKTVSEMCQDRTHDPRM